MNKNRRAFSLAGLIASTTALVGKDVLAQSSKDGYQLSGKPEAFVKKMGIKYPVVQAVIGGSTPDLAAAVSSAAISSLRRQRAVPAPNFNGAGKRPDFTPRYNVDGVIGVSRPPII